MNEQARAAIIIGGLGVGLFFASRDAAAFSSPGDLIPGVTSPLIINDHAELISLVPTPPQKQVFAWEDLRHFTKSEYDHPFDGDVSHLVDHSIVLALDELRAQLGCPIVISPAQGSIVRFSPGSQHDITGGRLSRAVDVFIPGCAMREVFNAAKSIPAIGGIGFYPDWKPRAGYHIDTRARNGHLATWMGRRTATGQTYVGVDWGFLDSLGAIA